jgi:hypothetical protein
MDRAKLLFAAACRSGAEGRLVDAIAAFEDIIRWFPNDGTLLSHAYGQLGHLHDLLGQRAAREASFREAVRHNPRSELCSLGLFHALLDRDELTLALREAVRLLEQRDSSEYRALFAEPAFGELRSQEDRWLVAQIRALLGS